jgi:hypothetical protein
MTSPFSPDDIDAAQTLADRWSNLGAAIALLGFAAAISGGWRGWSYTWCWLLLSVGLSSAYFIWDFVIVRQVHQFRPGILNFIKGGHGEAPAIGILLSPIMALPITIVARAIGESGSQLKRRFT